MLCMMGTRTQISLPTPYSPLVPILDNPLLPLMKEKGVKSVLLELDLRVLGDLFEANVFFALWQFFCTQQGPIGYC